MGVSLSSGSSMGDRESRGPTESTRSTRQENQPVSGRGRIFLTFDDGPDPIWTPLVLDALAEAGASATFFVIAPLARRYPSLIDRVRDSGHGVAFHCTQHVRHDALTKAEIRADTQTGLRALEQLGHPVEDWRTPWGFVVPATQEVAREHGLRLVGWTANTDDWRGDAPEEMLARVESFLVPGAIVLMHDRVGVGATREGCAGTVALVHPLVSLARSRGLEPAPLNTFRDPLPDRNPDFRTR